MALLATQSVLTAGIAATYSAVTASDTCVPGDNVVLHVKNGGGAPTNVTLTTPLVVDGSLTLQDRVVAITNGTDKFISVPAHLYQDPTTGLATFACSPTTSVTAAVLAV